jgi:hypothetical protein
MWVFISARLRQWILFAVAIPLATTVVHLVRVRLEHRSGQTNLVRLLTKLENLGQRQRRKVAGRS